MYTFVACLLWRVMDPDSAVRTRGSVGARTRASALAAPARPVSLFTVAVLVLVLLVPVVAAGAGTPAVEDTAVGGAVIGGTVAAGTVAEIRGGESRAGQAVRGSRRPLALVYRGPAACPDCPAATRTMLRTSPLKFRVRYVGPEARRAIKHSTLRRAALYVQPGGDTSVARADKLLGLRAQRVIRSYVRQGGRYLGICQGAYLAGSDPGMGMLAPGNTGQYIRSPRADTRSARDTVLPVTWGSRTVDMFFQDGPYFIPSGVRGESTLARYSNGTVAALTKPFGSGRIGVVGPHPEAPQRWYRWAGLVDADADGIDRRLGHHLVRHIMR